MAALSSPLRWRSSRNPAAEILSWASPAIELSPALLGPTIPEKIEAARQHYAAMILQRVSRGVNQRNADARARMAAAAIELRQRAHSQRVAFLAARRSATILEAASRGRAARRRLRGLGDAATAIEKMVRARTERQRQQARLGAATVIERYARGHLTRTRIEAQRVAATRIESHLRGHLILGRKREYENANGHRPLRRIDGAAYRMSAHGVRAASHIVPAASSFFGGGAGARKAKAIPTSDGGRWEAPAARSTAYASVPVGVLPPPSSCSARLWRVVRSTHTLLLPCQPHLRRTIDGAWRDEPSRLSPMQAVQMLYTAVAVTLCTAILCYEEPPTSEALQGKLTALGGPWLGAPLADRLLVGGLASGLCVGSAHACRMAFAVGNRRARDVINANIERYSWEGRRVVCPMECALPWSLTGGVCLCALCWVAYRGAFYRGLLVARLLSDVGLATVFAWIVWEPLVWLCAAAAAIALARSRRRTRKQSAFFGDAVAAAPATPPAAALAAAPAAAPAAASVKGVGARASARLSSRASKRLSAGGTSSSSSAAAAAATPASVRPSASELRHRWDAAHIQNKPNASKHLQPHSGPPPKGCDGRWVTGYQLVEATPSMPEGRDDVRLDGDLSRDLWVEAASGDIYEQAGAKRWEVGLGT